MRFTAKIIEDRNCIFCCSLPIAAKKTTLFQKIVDFRPIVSASQPLTLSSSILSIKYNEFWHFDIVSIFKNLIYWQLKNLDKIENISARIPMTKSVWTFEAWSQTRKSSVTIDSHGYVPFSRLIIKAWKMINFIKMIKYMRL